MGVTDLYSDGCGGVTSIPPQYFLSELKSEANKMNAQPLSFIDRDLRRGIELWYCDKCKKVYALRVKANDCCKEEKKLNEKVA